MTPLCSSTDSSTKKAKIYSWKEARRIARGHGFESKEEFLEYSCPGAYQLPKNPHEVWKEDWQGWDDWLGLTWNFHQGREIAHGLNIKSKDEYLNFMECRNNNDDSPAIRLPYRPDLKYKEEWKGWDDWLLGK